MEIIKQSKSLGLKVVCVGVGKVGCDVVDYMANHTPLDIDLITIAKELSTKNDEELQTLFSDADIVFTIVDFDDEREVLLCQTVTKMAQLVGAFNIVLSPKSLVPQNNKVLKESNTMLMMPYKSVSLEDTNFHLSQVVNEIYTLISPAEDDINLDLADIKTILGSQGVAMISIGKSDEGNSATEAIKMAMSSLLAENISLDKATGVVMHFTVHPNILLLDIGDAVDILYENLDENADCAFGISTDKALDKNFVKVTMISKFCC